MTAHTEEITDRIKTFTVSFNKTKMRTVFVLGVIGKKRNLDPAEGYLVVCFGQRRFRVDYDGESEPLSGDGFLV